MSPRGWLSGAGAFGLLLSACVGGQSGIETDPSSPFCEVTSTRAVDPDEMTNLGTVENLASIVEPAVSVPMTIFSDDGEDAHTTLTLVATVDRTSGQLTVRMPAGPEKDECAPVLMVQAALSFDTADGAFAEVFDGTIERGDGQTQFTGTLPFPQFRGNLDLTTRKKNVLNPRFDITTTLGPMPSGRLFIDGDDPGPNVVATSGSVGEWD